MPERPTLHDVARHAGVSTSTVSRVLNNHPHVGGRAREAVTRAMLDLGYQRNEVARSLRTNASLTVGLIVSELRNEVFAAIAQGVERVLVGADRLLVIASSDSDPAREGRVIREFERRGIDGLILTLVDERAQSTMKQLRELRAPVVLLDRDGKGLHADRVLTDHAPGVLEALNDLRAHGHERIGLLSPPNYVRAGREVRAAFASGAENGDLVRMGPLTEQFGHQAANELLSHDEPPTGLVIAGTQVLVGVLTAIGEFGLRVPHDLSIISYDDSAAARFHTPPISTIVRDCEQIGEFAARLVLERIDGRRTGIKKIFVPTVYEPRGSVAVPHARTANRVRSIAR